MEQQIRYIEFTISYLQHFNITVLDLFIYLLCLTLLSTIFQLYHGDHF